MIKEFVQGITFKEMQPMTVPLPDEYARLDFEANNVTFPFDDEILRYKLFNLKRVVTNKFCTFAIAGIINKAVELMPEGSVYLNIGILFGYSLFAGRFGNNDKVCIGVDNFCENSYDEFVSNFKFLNVPVTLFKQDYKEYLEKIHKDPIGVYYYDALHDINNQYDALVIAEKYFVDGCVIIVDDTNWHAPIESTMKFLEERPGKYEILLDVKTATNCHPTFWNGLMVFQKKGQP